jgi:hypothetical protein
VSGAVWSQGRPSQFDMVVVSGEPPFRVLYELKNPNPFPRFRLFRWWP